VHLNSFGLLSQNNPAMGMCPRHTSPPDRWNEVQMRLVNSTQRRQRHAQSDENATGIFQIFLRVIFLILMPADFYEKVRKIPAKAPSVEVSVIMIGGHQLNKRTLKTMKILTAALLFTLALGGASSLQGGDKKSKKGKPSLMCRIPIIKHTPLCSTHNKQQIERLAPKIPTR